MEGIMEYKEGSTQYLNETLKRGDNISFVQSAFAFGFLKNFSSP